MSPVEQAKMRAIARHREQVLRAREDPVAFMSYVMRDTNPATYGQRLKIQPFHAQWQHHMEANRWWLIKAAVGLGKSTSVVSRILWRMGRFPERRVAICGGVADKLLKEIRQYIERSVELREVFPDLVPSEDPSDPWTDAQITIKRKMISKDPTLQVASELADIVGSRVDDLYLDDILNMENTNTEYSREKTLKWVDSTCQTRVTPTIGRVGIIGTPWHKDDALAKLEERPDFIAIEQPVVENPDELPEKWVSVWPDVWTVPELLRIRGNTTDHEFQRTRLCRVRLDATARFKEAWIIHCARAGHGMKTHAFALKAGQRQLPHFCGVDLGAGKKEVNARTSIAVGALLDDGRIRPVEIDHGLFTGPETVDKLLSVSRRYGARIMVESNATQIFLVQFLEQHQDVQVEAFYTGQNKWDPRFGIESLAVEFRQGMWQLPCAQGSDFTDVRKVKWASSGIAALVSQALYFDPSQHTGDVLMSVWLLRECARRYAGDRTHHVNLLAR